MTAPAIDTTTVELPEFDPACEHPHHNGDESAAFFVSGHRDRQCYDGFRCVVCVSRNARLFEQYMHSRGYAVCAYCKERFTDYDQFNKVVALP